MTHPITDAQIAHRLGMPRQKVRYYRTRPTTTKSRRCATEVAIEQAKEELKQEIINSLTNGLTGNQQAIQEGR